MTRNIKYFFIPNSKVKTVERVIEVKKQCLENRLECSSEEIKEINKLLEKFRKEFKNLPKNVEELKKSLEIEFNNLSNKPEELKKLLKKEYGRKRTIEDKSKSLLTVISLLGIALAFLFKLAEGKLSMVFLWFLGGFIFLELLYLIGGLKSLLYILCEINVVYEPISDQIEELRKNILLNRYQNINRTNYLNGVYSNIKLFFYLLLLVFITYFLSLVTDS